MKDGGAQAVKLEGGQRVVPQVEALVAAGIPVMAHIGLTPQSVNALGGYRVQGRGDEAAHRLLQDAKALQHAGAFAVVLEVVPSEVAAAVTHALQHPDDRHRRRLVVRRAGARLAGHGRASRRGQGPPSSSRSSPTSAAVLHDAASRYADEVRVGTYPAAEHEYH